jgi:hypothetical protein
MFWIFFCGQGISGKGFRIRQGLTNVGYNETSLAHTEAITAIPLG